MLLARHMDVAAHELRQAGQGHYTICSSGHEGNVVLGRLTAAGDPALLHYRSAALQIERARSKPHLDAALDIALSLVASSEDPISGGRHKVFGHAELGILPQTSTIASHLPRAVGLALAIERRARMGLPPLYARDAIVLTSFGDASINHSTWLGALNTASWILHQKLTLPLLCVCEDNGLGISVRTPEGWTDARLNALPHIRYFACDGWDLARTYATARAAVEYCRSSRRAAMLHLRCVRLLGHAGTDVDTSYRSPAEIGAAEARDPVLCAALDLLSAGALEQSEILDLDAAARTRAEGAAAFACTRPKLQAAHEIVAPIARRAPAAEIQAEATRELALDPERASTLGHAINRVLAEALDRYPEALIFGEDVAKKGGVYGITKGLLTHAGPKRVFNTLLDEQSILGFALGAASAGLLPIAEIQYLAYLHNAEDQLRGEAATLSFFSSGAYDNPLLVRIAGLAYQKGFGGHFHNDNSLAVLRDIPGLVVFVPARADDAFELYRTALALCRRERRVVVAVEPIALYHTRDLYQPSDGGWLASPSGACAEFGRARVYHPEARDLLIVTYGNGLFMSLRAARELGTSAGIGVRVLDLRWLAPLPLDDVLEHAREVGRVLVVDECRRSGNVSEALGTALFENLPETRFARVTSADSFVPLGSAANLVLVSEADIVRAALDLTRARVT
ncbi:MAG TPA: thiamine pyrophosphate-dependent enzyme [Polyangiaceae bacterium]|nr:thiamine pyrophosphate-dependent enzyme [Polyangiaceae bacterium]